MHKRIAMFISLLILTLFSSYTISISITPPHIISPTETIPTDDITTQQHSSFTAPPTASHFPGFIVSHGAGALGSVISRAFPLLWHHLRTMQLPKEVHLPDYHLTLSGLSLQNGLSGTTSVVTDPVKGALHVTVTDFTIVVQGASHFHRFAVSSSSTFTITIEKTLFSIYLLLQKQDDGGMIPHIEDLSIEFHGFHIQYHNFLARWLMSDGLEFYCRTVLQNVILSSLNEQFDYTFDIFQSFVRQHIFTNELNLWSLDAHLNLHSDQPPEFNTNAMIIDYQGNVIEPRLIFPSFEIIPEPILWHNLRQELSPSFEQFQIATDVAVFHSIFQYYHFYRVWNRTIASNNNLSPQNALNIPAWTVTNAWNDIIPQFTSRYNNTELYFTIQLASIPIISMIQNIEFNMYQPILTYQVAINIYAYQNITEMFQQHVVPVHIFQVMTSFELSLSITAVDITAHKKTVQLQQQQNQQQQSQQHLFPSPTSPSLSSSPSTSSPSSPNLNTNDQLTANDVILSWCLNVDPSSSSTTITSSTSTSTSSIQEPIVTKNNSEIETILGLLHFYHICALPDTPMTSFVLDHYGKQPHEQLPSSIHSNAILSTLSPHSSILQNETDSITNETNNNNNNNNNNTYLHNTHSRRRRLTSRHFGEPKFSHRITHNLANPDVSEQDIISLAAFVDTFDYIAQNRIHDLFFPIVTQGIPLPIFPAFKIGNFTSHYGQAGIYLNATIDASNIPDPINF